MCWKYTWYICSCTSILFPFPISGREYFWERVFLKWTGAYDKCSIWARWQQFLEDCMCAQQSLSWASTNVQVVQSLLSTWFLSYPHIALRRIWSDCPVFAGRTCNLVGLPYTLARSVALESGKNREDKGNPNPEIRHYQQVYQSVLSSTTCDRQFCANARRFRQVRKKMKH